MERMTWILKRQERENQDEGVGDTEMLDEFMADWDESGKQSWSFKSQHVDEVVTWINDNLELDQESKFSLFSHSYLLAACSSGHFSAENSSTTHPRCLKRLILFLHQYRQDSLLPFSQQPTRVVATTSRTSLSRAQETQRRFRFPAREVPDCDDSRLNLRPRNRQEVDQDHR